MPLSPRRAFQELKRLNLITEDEVDLLEGMIEDRNQTTHVYDHAMALDICMDIERYYIIIEKLIQLMDQES